MNPLLSIWTQPTKTLEYMLTNKTVAYGFLIYLLSSISVGSVAFATTGLFGSMPLAFIVIISIVISYGSALLGWVITAALYTWVGKWLGGRGKFSDMIRVTPVYVIPVIWIAPMNFLLIAVYGTRLFEVPTENFGLTNLPLGVYFLQNILMIGISIYGTVLTCKGVGLVHGFSAWRGLGVVAIIIGIFVAFSIIIGIAFAAIIFSLFATFG